MGLPTLTDLKKHINTTENDDDLEMQDVLDAAIDVAESIVGPLRPGSVTEIHYGLRSDVLVLRRAPVTSLTTVSSLVAGVTTDLTLADYQVDPATGVVRRADGGWLAGNYTITYATGRDIPAAISLGVLIIAAHLWETQRVPGARRPTTFGQAMAEQQPTPMGFAIPNRAATLLEPYRQPVIA